MEQEVKLEFGGDLPLYSQTSFFVFLNYCISECSCSCSSAAQCRVDV